MRLDTHVAVDAAANAEYTRNALGPQGKSMNPKLTIDIVSDVV